VGPVRFARRCVGVWPRVEASGMASIGARNAGVSFPVPRYNQEFVDTAVSSRTQESSGVPGRLEAEGK
jgi:hypothetical protein